MIDCEYTRDITCPHCGHQDRDSWETDFGDDAEGNAEVECADCGKEFKVYRHIEVTYTSRKVEPEETEETEETG